MSLSMSPGVPIGTIVAFALDAKQIPPGWLLCGGHPVDSQKYPHLSNLMERTPNLCGRTLIGADQLQNGGNYKLNDTGGEEKHQLKITEMPSHNHDASATITSTFYFGTDDECDDGESGWCIAGPRNVEARHMHDLGLKASVTTNKTGSDCSHNNMQPYYVINYIIYAGGVND